MRVSVGGIRLVFENCESIYFHSHMVDELVLKGVSCSFHKNKYKCKKIKVILNQKADFIAEPKGQQGVFDKCKTFKRICKSDNSIVFIDLDILIDKQYSETIALKVPYAEMYGWGTPNKYQISKKQSNGSLVISIKKGNWKRNKAKAKEYM